MLKESNNIDFEKALLIGEGGFGTVYHFDKENPSYVVKLIKCDTKGLKSYQTEWEILKKLKHEHIVKPLWTKEIIFDRRLAFAIGMEYCERESLDKIIHNSTFIYSMRTVTVWAENIFGALAYLVEEHNIVHRDIKPNNILVKANFSVKLGDFGCAKEVEETCVDSKVWSEYNQEGVFDLGRFHRGVIERKVVQLTPPKCAQVDVQRAVVACTRFNNNHRPTAAEMHQRFICWNKKDAFCMSLPFLPKVDITEKRLIRPIGFNGQRNVEPIVKDITPPKPQLSDSSTVKRMAPVAPVRATAPPFEASTTLGPPPAYSTIILPTQTKQTRQLSCFQKFGRRCCLCLVWLIGIGIFIAFCILTVMFLNSDLKTMTTTSRPNIDYTEVTTTTTRTTWFAPTRDMFTPTVPPPFQRCASVILLNENLSLAKYLFSKGQKEVECEAKLYGKAFGDGGKKERATVALVKEWEVVRATNLRCWTELLATLKEIQDEYKEKREIYGEKPTL
ncbi:unnamed protein product, partial [Mesorhabditis belari]|uniref:Protein kinase domain-containing protein n=1 Tax=Mesorhabditis belari TaxID=2138241 RepID=A0AAF3F372_9BILA